MTKRAALLRWTMQKLIRLSLWAIGPRMTLWSLYCIFAKVWSAYCPVELQADGTKITVPWKGGAETKLWATVCEHLLECADACGAYEESAGFVHTAERVNENMTCRVWIKTTDKFPWLK